MTKTKFLNINAQSLPAILEQKGIQGIIEPLWFGVDIYEDYATYQSDLAPYSQAQRYVLAVQWYFAETSNGGHDQFFSNSTGIVWQDAVAGLHFFGLPELAQNLQNAVETLGTSSFDRDERNEQLDLAYERLANFSELVNEFDSALYREEEKEQIIENYILTHPEEFFFAGEVPDYNIN